MVKKDNLTECNIANLDFNESYNNFLKLHNLTNEKDSTMKNRLNFLALKSSNISSFLILCKIAKGDSTVIACQKLINSLNQDLFKPLNYFNAKAHDSTYFFTALGNYNDSFNSFDKKYRINPFKIQTEDFDKYLNSSVLSNDIQHKTTAIEDYLKTMFLSNRTAKLFERFNDYNLQDTVNDSDKNFEKDRETLQNICNQTYSRLSDIDIFKNEDISKSDLINLFNEYQSNKITNEQLLNSPIYTKFENIIQKYTEEIVLKSNCKFTIDDICITPETLYKHYSFEKVINRSYSLKNKMWQKAYVEYANMIKSKNGDKSEEEKIKSLIRITSFPSPTKNERFDTSLCFILKDYNIPFQIHVNSSALKKGIDKYGVEIEHGKINIPFKPILPYKYAEKDIKMLNQYINQNKNYVKTYSKEYKIMDYTEQMINGVDNLSLSTPPQKKNYIR